MPMLLSDRWAVDPKQKQELDEIRRKVAADFGETFPPPPPAPSVCPRRGLLPCPRFTLDDLTGVRVEVGQRPGQRRVFLASGGLARHNGVTSDELEVVVNATGDRSRTVRIRESAVPRRCLVCKAQANKRCPVCKVFYCSAKCQLDDWPSHQTTCGVQKGQPSPLQQRTTADEKQGATQARPCGQVGQSQSVERQTPGPIKTKLPSPKPTPLPAAREQPIGEARKSDERVGANPAMPAKAAFLTPKGPPVRAELPRAVQLEPASLPMDESVEVTVCYGTDLSELFLQRASSLPALSELQARLQAVCFTGGAYRPSPGSACAAQFEDDGQWYRARVATLRDGRCTVYFVDYGNSADVAAAQTCPLPEGCAELPEQAVRCGLYGVRPKGGGGWGEGATLELATLMQGRLMARACRVAGGKHEVELRAHDGPSLSEVLVAKGLAESTLPSPPSAPAPRRLASVLGLAKPGEALMLQVTASKEGRIWVLVAHPGVTTQLLEVEQELNERCPKMAEGASPARGISSGDYVASKSLEDGRWYRACVARATPAGHTVRYVDYGNEEANTRVVPLDERHLKVGAASARLDAKDATSLPLGATLSFTVGAAAGDGAVLHGQLVCEDDQKTLGTATLSPWDSGLGGEAPAAPLAVPKAAAKVDKVDSKPKPAEPVEEVKPRSMVQPLLPEPRVLDVPVRPLPAAKRRMQAVWRTQDVLFLHQEDQAEQLAAMMVQLNAWVGEASPPAPAGRLAKGDYVCALFSQDDTWYRGQLMSDRSAEGSFRVLFIDYGNSEVVPLGSLRPLPPRFAEQPLFAMCVVPQGVSPLDPRLEGLLSEQPFAAVQVGSQKGVPVVRLVRRDGTCINDMLAGQDPQTPPKEAAPAKQAPAKQAPATPPASAPTSALASALAAKVLPKAAVVHTIAECPKPQGRFEALVSTVDSNTVYVLPIAQRDALARVSQALASEGEHSATAMTKLPMPSQCVLALYSADKLWYRARVLSADHDTRQVQVRFVDFGNVETVSVKDVRPLREELAREPACVLPVVLAGVARLAPNAVDLLPAEVLTVEPTDNASPPSVRLMHAGTCINDRVASQPEPPKKKLADNPLPSGRVAATVAHIALPDGLFYLQQTSLASGLLAMMEELNASAATAPKPASLKLGDAVCARYAVDGLWYRGAVVEPAKDTVGPLKILFVDFGNSEDVPKADLKALPEKFEAVPLFANCVVLDAVASVSQECAQQLVSAEVEVEVADASCQPPKVRLYVNGSCINELVE
ncbi:tudor domain-containing protein 1 isoform X3 [Ixodes scapularis]|nr:tudor domain-containing protein 1 isoform X3 [Ixodes scapularis]